MILLLDDSAALQRIGAEEITALTERATAATFYRDGLTPAELDANRRVVLISAETAFGACANDHQRFTAAFVGDRLAGYVISTVHALESREVDWLMVDPDFHGSGVADSLMRAGVDWLGTDRPMWLNVLQHNDRAVGFYRRHGFEVDPTGRTEHLIPHYIMRRQPTAGSG